MSSLYLYAIPVFVVTMLAERALTTRRTGVVGYEIRDSLASLAMGVGYLAILAPFGGLHYAAFAFLYEHRLFHVPDDAAWMWPALVVAEDFCFYGYHRTSHQVRFFWATHVNHHSSERYNLSTALRQPWLNPVVAPVFWFPLPLLGFDPLHVATAHAVSLLYQYALHTELVGKLPRAIEWIFNAPSHHRVHHGSDPHYLDRNHGGILIIWDRLFGTFEPETETPHYGLTRNINTFHPVHIAFHEVVAMCRDVRSARTLRGKVAFLLGPPGWHEDGTGKTSKDLRQEALTQPAVPADG